MNRKDLVFYFLTENVHIEKERNELEYLRKLGRVVLVSTGFAGEPNPGVRHLNVKPQSLYITRLCILWSKLCYLLCHIAKTQSDRQFTVRNVYSGSKLIRGMVNLLWKIKIHPFVNNLLPKYDTLYFAPFIMIESLFGKKRIKSVCTRIVVHDSLIVRLNKFPYFITYARLNGIPTIGNIKSWDNPYYSQLATKVNGYFVWSHSMWADVQYVHEIKNKYIHAWGARPFYQYHKTLQEFRSAPTFASTSCLSDSLMIGYAAAFCDELMGYHEIQLIKKISQYLEKSIPDAMILFRPYPIIPLVFYSELAQCKNIKLVDIGGEITVYDDGKKKYEHKVGSDIERLQYLTKCNSFLSIATSFTIEAAMFNLPIVHFYLEPEECTTEAEIEFFKRVSISDHLSEYFKKELLLSTNYDSLVSNFLLIKENKLEVLQPTGSLLKRLGVPSVSQDWDVPTQTLKKELLELAITLGGQ